MSNSKAEILREYGPFDGVEGVHGVTYDGENVWFCSGGALNAFDPDSGKTVRVGRQVEGGLEVFDLPLPAVVSAQKGLNEPRYPTLKGIMGAKKKPLATFTASDAGIEADRVGFDNARAHCSDFAVPPSKEAGKIIEDEDTNETVEQIVAWLDERKLLA